MVRMGILFKLLIACVFASDEGFYKAVDILAKGEVEKFYWLYTSSPFRQTTPLRSFTRFIAAHPLLLEPRQGESLTYVGSRPEVSVQHVDREYVFAFEETDKGWKVRHIRQTPLPLRPDVFSHPSPLFLVRLEVGEDLLIDNENFGATLYLQNGEVGDRLLWRILKGEQEVWRHTYRLVRAGDQLLFQPFPPPQKWGL